MDSRSPQQSPNNKKVTPIILDRRLTQSKSIVLEKLPQNTEENRPQDQTIFVTQSTLRSAISVVYYIFLISNFIVQKVHFKHFCFRHHVPFAFYILFLLNNLFVVFNSSVNFIVYCCVSTSFRKRTFHSLRLKKTCCPEKNSNRVT